MTAPGLKYWWYRFRNEFGEVVACVDISVEEDKPFCVGFAFCSPEDRNRNKKIGRDIAQGRLVKGKGLFIDILHERFKNAKSDREIILTFLKTAEFSDLGVRPYNGRVDGDHFQKWFTQFREELIKNGLVFEIFKKKQTTVQEKVYVDKHL